MGIFVPCPSGQAQHRLDEGCVERIGDSGAHVALVHDQVGTGDAAGQMSATASENAVN